MGLAGARARLPCVRKGGPPKTARPRKHNTHSHPTTNPPPTTTKKNTKKIAHPELADRDFYVTGESYAGHYVPAVANRVYRARELGEGRPIKLAGAAIGNGLTVPAVQYGAYADYALQEGVISQGTRDSIQWWYPACRWSINLCESYRWRWLCGLSMTWCQLSVFGRILGSAPGINVYDIRKQVLCCGLLLFVVLCAGVLCASQTLTLIPPTHPPQKTPQKTNKKHNKKNTPAKSASARSATTFPTPTPT